ncbi:hypothetical protein L829_4438 [Mycobacteroides abscessus MAB_030201_1075]|uniref:Uncharacterized protein n=2 Tax=Mycobacteroides abscessus TaxID=36809 RepID=A0A829QJ61_9MYCO|nr:hypothetical protein MA4S0303_3604 [Mycobacteroides abscessus 4S-0303]EIT91798.1 hypothetical protein MA4S0726RB_3129 [Mycobacteroides abscessus 4S-0726-RB]EIT95346.1 hypothetical protein MA4S0726RA_3538 [Mycobacteroides abscessus 4S-0726-RA]EIU36500.1 hypothetical protein MA6G0125S_3945 [Mycobacteroides abscessus 6G-0125-S]EIU39145.1 hypothetical protein MA6G0125R_2902 [Mycobacteroides abscessus 6G-0125-R]EIU53406.1 hypothetical protein MA6G0728S_3629 [Mycobacteroides abscessus 6G-0728-S]
MPPTGRCPTERQSPQLLNCFLQLTGYVVELTGDPLDTSDVDPGFSHIDYDG